MSTGVIRDLSIADYHGATALSHSKLEVFRRRPALYKRRYVDGMPSLRDPQDFRMGTAVHAGLEGPIAWRKAVSLNTEFDSFRSNAAKTWRAEQVLAGKVVLTLDEKERVGSAINALQSHREFGRMVCNAASEVTFRASHKFLPLLLQCRTDIWNEKEAAVVDVKTCQSLDDDAAQSFQKNFWRYGYHRQAAFYRTIMRLCGFSIKEFFFAAVEIEEPFGCQVYRCGEEAFTIGDEENGEDLRALVHCYETGIWPNCPEEILEIELPEWYVRRANSA